MDAARLPKNDRYSILIFSASDARKKPISLNIRKGVAAFAAVCLLLVVALAVLFSRSAIVRAQDDSKQIAQLQRIIDDQFAQIRIKSDEIASLEGAISIIETEDAQDRAGSFVNMNATDGVLLGTNGMRNGKMELVDWFQGGSELFGRYKKATVVDVMTGLRFNVRRIGGHYHADSEPLTKEDTEIMHRIYGNRWSWKRRAIVLIVDDRYIAASMNGMPHGNDPSLSNGFSGHFCIHLLHSRIHATGKECSVHQSAVMYALENGNSVL